MKIFTKEEQQIVELAIHNTWQSIGSEVYQCCAEGGERLTNEAALEIMHRC